MPFSIFNNQPIVNRGRSTSVGTVARPHVSVKFESDDLKRLVVDNTDTIVNIHVNNIVNNKLEIVLPKSSSYMFTITFVVHNIKQGQSVDIAFMSSTQSLCNIVMSSIQYQQTIQCCNLYNKVHISEIMVNQLY